MDKLKTNLVEGAKENRYPGASRKLTPEVHIEQGIFKSAGGNPKPTGRNPDLGVLKQEIAGVDPLREWNAQAGQRATNVFERGTLDVKVGGGYVRDKGGFMRETGGLTASELRPFSKATLNLQSEAAESISGKLARASGHLKTAAKRLGAAVPVVGMVLGHASAAHAAASGDVQGAALDEFGNVPIAGDLVDAGRAGYSVGEAINEFLPEDVKNAIGGTINEIVSEGGWKEIVRHPFGIGM